MQYVQINSCGRCSMQSYPFWTIPSDWNRRNIVREKAINYNVSKMANPYNFYDVLDFFFFGYMTVETERRSVFLFSCLWVVCRILSLITKICRTEWTTRCAFCPSKLQKNYTFLKAIDTQSKDHFTVTVFLCETCIFCPVLSTASIGPGDAPKQSCSKWFWTSVVQTKKFCWSFWSNNKLKGFWNL